MNDEYKLNPALLESFNKLSQTLTENFKEQLNSLDDPSCRISRPLASAIGSAVERSLNISRQRLAEAIDNNTIKLPDEYINELSSNFSELWKIAVKSISPAFDQLFEKSQEYIDFLNSSVDITTSEKLKDEVTHIVKSMPIEEEQKLNILSSEPLQSLEQKDPWTKTKVIALLTLILSVISYIFPRSGDTYIIINTTESASVYDMQQEHQNVLQQQIDNMFRTIEQMLSSCQDDKAPEELDSPEQDADFLLSDVDSSRPDGSDDYIGEEMK